MGVTSAAERYVTQSTDGATCDLQLLGIFVAQALRARQWDQFSMEFRQWVQVLTIAYLRCLIRCPQVGLQPTRGLD